MKNDSTLLKDQNSLKQHLKSKVAHLKQRYLSFVMKLFFSFCFEKNLSMAWKILLPF